MPRALLPNDMLKSALCLETVAVAPHPLPPLSALCLEVVVGAVDIYTGPASIAWCSPRATACAWVQRLVACGLAEKIGLRNGFGAWCAASESNLGSRQDGGWYRGVRLR